MSYNVHFQTDASYKNVKYGQGTVYSSGCGPASLCNALDALGIASVTVKAMCAYWGSPSKTSCTFDVSGGKLTGLPTLNGGTLLVVRGI